MRSALILSIYLDVLGVLCIEMDDLDARNDSLQIWKSVNHGLPPSTAAELQDQTGGVLTFAPLRTVCEQAEEWRELAIASPIDETD